MIEVKINESEVRELTLEKIEERLKQVDTELVFWDRNELMRRTCMSWTFIQQQFFYDERFPRRRVGKKWLFPAEETKRFLLQWLAEQPR